VTVTKVQWNNKSQKKITPLWQKCIGGGRVAEALRADFQKHLECIQREIKFDYIRMHGIFCDDMMVYREECQY